jgi:hypothetical protein
MVVVPTPTPVTTPLDELTVAAPVLVLLQVPPAVGLNIVSVLPLITVYTLAKLGVNAVTVTVRTANPPPTVYVIFTAAANRPVTSPELEPTVAIPPLALVHTPPGVVELSVTD